MPYRINEFADITGVAAPNIRFYEKKGYPEAGRNASGYRQYGFDEILQLTFFLDMQAQGFSVSECIDRLKPQPVSDYCKSLAHNSRKLEDEIWFLQQKKRWIDHLQYCYSHIDQELHISHEITIPDQCFLKIAVDEDFTMSLGNGQQIAAWTELLPVSHFGGIFTQVGTPQISEDLGLFMNVQDAEKMGLLSENICHYQGREFLVMMTATYDINKILADPRIASLEPSSLSTIYYLPLKVMTTEYGNELNYMLFRL